MLSSLSAGVHPSFHVGVIMDGNGRWAQQRGLPRSKGHREGLKAARALVESALREKVAYLTLFAFSNENWRRPAAEVDALLSLFAEALKEEGGWLRKNKVALRFIGDHSGLPKSLVAGMKALATMTQKGKAMRLTLAIGYSGRWDIVAAAKKLAASGQAGQAATEENFAGYLSTGDMPPLDLLIRTGGEKRISNFMLWQAAYAELYFTETLWPDFNAADLRAALDDYNRRERRFGGVPWGDDDDDDESDLTGTKDA